MPKKTIDQVDVNGKRVLMRVDFNVPIENGTITDDRRIRMTLPAIDSVVSRGGRLVLISHLGRPKGRGYEADASLAPVAARLRELRPKLNIGFPSQDCVDEQAAAAVRALKPGEVVLLENLRFHGGEKNGDTGFAGKLATLGDIYCNDAFGTAHRPDASMVALPKAMAGKPRVVGPLLAKEIKYLSEALRGAEHPFVAVLGGSKVSDKLAAIGNLLAEVDAVLVGGAMAYTFLKALGHRVGSSLVEDNMLGKAKAIIEEAANRKTDLVLPVDHVCGRELARHTPIRVFEEHIDDGWMGLDIGPSTIGRFGSYIGRARTVVWNGPVGAFEILPFDIGTRQVATMIAARTDSGALTICGGGDTAAAVELAGVADRFSHVSTGGGASLELLEGRSFESLAQLDEA
ncbi:MAG: phosphoglycerate kinase [Phycisphaerales bacterium]|nr:phosphoglycerate kinase [Phycisphaerales bacterium]